MAKDKKLTVEKSTADFKKAYQAKRKLIERQKEDFLFALGKQWSDEDVAKLKQAGIKPITDNRIQPNLFLLTGLQRQNRTDFKAFPEGEEDSLKAEIASSLFKNAVKNSDFSYKVSDQFKDGVTCGESHLELYLDNTQNLLNGKPCWKKIDGNMVFPEPGYREYDYSDARYVYKLTPDLSQDDLISLYPDKAKAIEEVESGKLDYMALQGGIEKHTQRKDYPTTGGESEEDKKDGAFDLLERYYKKWVEKVFVGDKQTGELKESIDLETAENFVNNYTAAIQQEQAQYSNDLMAYQMAEQQAAVDPVIAEQVAVTPPPIEPTPKDLGRFVIIKRRVPEVWIYAHVPGIEEPLADEVAWFYPKWKVWPIIPYFARFSTAPLKGDDRHLLIQGIVHGVKDVQEKHNKAELLTLRHLNSTANSGWLAEEDSWVDAEKVKDFGATPGVNLEYKKGSQKPERIYPIALSAGHAVIASESAEAIKAQLGINADLLAAQEGSSQSGRAIALRQRQGLLMVQEVFDNLSRTQITAGKLMLSQLGKMYDTETAKKVLGETFLINNFPAPQILNEQTGQPEAMPDKDGQPMQYDKEMAEVAIAEVLSGDLGMYDVNVGEAVASETMRMANSAEVKEIAQAYPGLIPPDILVDESQLPQATKSRILKSIQQAQAMQQSMTQAPRSAGPEDTAR